MDFKKINIGRNRTGKTLEDVKKYCENRGLDLLSDKYINTRQELNLQCKVCGNDFKLRFELLRKRKHSCFECFSKLQSERNLKYTRKDVDEECKKRNVICLTKNYTDALNRMELKCLNFGCEHVWSSTFSKFRKGIYGCPKCYRNKNGLTYEGKFYKISRYNIDLVREICFEKHLIVLDAFYVSQDNPMKFRCNLCNEDFEKTFKNVLLSEFGCRKCSLKNRGFKILPEDLKKICMENGYEFLDSRNNLKPPYKIKCKKCNYISMETSSFIKYNNCRNCIKDQNQQRKKSILQKLLKDTKLLNCEISVWSIRRNKVYFTCKLCNQEFSKYIKKSTKVVNCPTCYGRVMRRRGV